MKTFMIALLIATCSTLPAVAHSETAPAASVVGKTLLDANGKYLGIIYKVTADHSAQVILDDRIVTIPANTISLADGKFTTSLIKQDLRKIR